jgi:hypothetical protein
MRAVVIAAGLLFAAPAVAQVSNPPVAIAIDTSNFPTKAEVKAAQDAAAAAKADADAAKAQAAAVSTAATSAQSKADTAASTASAAKTSADQAAAALAAAQAQAQAAATAAATAKSTADAAKVAADTAAGNVSTAQTTATSAKTAADAAATRVEVVAATVPKPATAVPPTEMVGGSTGTAGTYRPADSAAPRITRAGVVTTSASTGDWSITWTTPLMAVPVVVPIPVNTTTQPLVCNVATRSITGATGRCWLARTLPATLLSLTALVTYDVFGSAATGVQVQILAIPPTQ